MEAKKNTHGGKRAGAGRPTVENKRVQITATLSPDSVAKILELKRQGVPVWRLIDDYIATL